MNTTKLSKYTVYFANSEEFHHLRREVFTNHSYYFEAKVTKPTIIDAGAHIGLATLYFKQLYPEAQIIAVEPIPENFALLQKNINENQLSYIELIQAALAPHAGTTTLYRDQENSWLSSSSILPGGWNHTQKTQPISVPAITLSSLLLTPVHLLKLDIEGMEATALLEARTHLRMVEHLIVEFHPHRQQSLPRIIEYLQQFFPFVEITQNNKAVDPKSATGLCFIEAWKNHEK